MVEKLMPEKPLVDYGRFLAEIEYQAQLLIDTARPIPPDTLIRTCPGWTVDEVLRHVGDRYRSALGWLIEGQHPDRWQQAPISGQTVEEYLQEGLAELSSVFAQHTPQDRAVNWWGQESTYSSWCRRIAHETTVHCVDVAVAADRKHLAVPVDFALDGVDEALSLWFGHRLARLGLSGTRTGTITVQAQDYVWLVHTGPGQTTVQRCTTDEALRSDAVVSGHPASLYLWLWGRGGPGSIVVEGDADAVGQLWALMRLATR